MKSDKLQDAIGMVKDEYIEEAHPEAKEEQKQGAWNVHPNGYQGNSWTALAMNTARRDKLKEGKDKPYQWYSRITMIAACIILALVVVIPKFGDFNFGRKEEMATEHETISSETSESSTAGESAGSAAASDGADSHSYSAIEEKEEAKGEEAAEAVGDAKEDVYIEPYDPYNPQYQAEAFRLTAAEWNDNNNWPFFLNLVNSGLIDFPAYGVDPRQRVKVTLTDQSGNYLKDQEVALFDEWGNQLWTARTNKNGVGYLFYPEGVAPYRVVSNGVEQQIEVATTTGEDFQGSVMVSSVEDINMTVPTQATQKAGTQVMFIVDTTGSMADELAYLQRDFAAIAEETFDENMEFSANFYRDSGDVYVTRTNSFTKNLATVQNLLNAEYATGGGDLPEAVAEILTETITNNQEWKEDYNKVAFLIFDAPPHDGTDQIVEAAVKSAAARGIHLVPVVASNADRATELFGRAIAICTDGTYVFLTDDSGIGNSHLEPIVGDYQVELLHSVIVRIINSYKQ